MSMAMVAKGEQSALSAYERAIVFGDITGLDEAGRKAYLQAMCASLNLDPATKPFGYMSQWTPQGDRLVFYLTATGAAQLRLQHAISFTKVVDEGEASDGIGKCYRWTVYGRMPNGREDVEIGSKPLYKGRDKAPVAGIEYENARKASLTQAKTRLTKSLTGLAGVLSEDEVDAPTPAGGRTTVLVNNHDVDTSTGEVLPASTTEPPRAAKKVGPIQQAIADTLERIRHHAPAYQAPAPPKTAEEGKQQVDTLKWDLVAIEGLAADYTRLVVRWRVLDPEVTDVEPLAGTVADMKAQVEQLRQTVGLLEPEQAAMADADNLASVEI